MGAKNFMLSHSIFLIFVLFSNSGIWDLFNQADQLVYKPLPRSIQIEFHLKSYGDFPELLNRDILGVSIRKDPITGEDVVALYFNNEGAKKLADITRNNVGEKLVVFINRQLIIAPIIKEEMKDGQAIIAFGYNPTPEELKILALFKEAYSK